MAVAGALIPLRDLLVLSSKAPQPCHAEMLLYTMTHPCRHLDGECAKLQVKGVLINEQGVLLQDTCLGGDSVQMFG